MKTLDKMHAVREKPCGRCGRPFKPEYLDALKRMSRMCETCMVRNLFDNLDMKTPPELLDAHTKNPALTEGEFKRSLKSNE